MIAAYQAAETVGDAISSALEQTYAAHEVIVVDDGSTDDTRGALRPYADRIRLLTKENGGAASARNVGARAATGEFLVILDADDTYHPRRLEALAEIASARPDLDLITTDASLIVEGESVSTFATHTPFAIENQRTAIFQSCFVGGWPAVRLERLLASGGFDESMQTGSDWECWTRLILEGSQAGLIDEPLYLYRLHPGTLTSNRVSSLWDRVKLLEKNGRSSTLRPEERTALQCALRRHRSRAVAAEAQAVLYGSASASRLLRLAFLSGIEPRARLSAIAALVAPPLGRRLVPRYHPAEERLAAELR